MNNNLHLRTASIPDAKVIHTLLLDTAKEGLLLPRPLADIYSHLRDFIILEDASSGEVLGCSALSIFWDDLAEIRSLVVRKEARGLGGGRILVEAQIEETKRLGITKLFTLTYQDVFFNKLGFRIVDKEVLPNKIWTDCIHCPKYPDCDEIAMLMDI